MNWFAGNIAEAVNVAKTRGAVFVVYVEGTDELSKKLTAIIDEEDVRKCLESSCFVAIKIQSDSEAYVQFAQIYKLVPLPSIFFIGANGQPIDIVTGVITSSRELLDRLKTVASRAQINLPTSTASERLKDQETQRRQSGRDLQAFKERQHELDLLQMKEERQRDKLADKAARKRILDQIAQDRAERAQRLNLTAANPPAEADNANKYVPPKVNADFTRIQFKKPNGESEMHTFNSSDKFEAVRAYVADSVVRGAFGSYILASTFPRREYTAEDDEKSMSELDLTPSAVILILPNEKSLIPIPIAARAVKPLGTVNRYFWVVFTQVMVFFNYIKRLIWRKDNNETGAQKRGSEETISANDMAKRRNLRYPTEDAGPSTSAQSTSGAPYRRHQGSNIHRLHDNKDSDDENNTWNGNSTQQQ
ncbi:UBX domain-containing protein 4, partial [Pseudolycoriella hygida]